ncbi:hypothetical protein CB0940_02753 [Cercospora beticola]|uniref:SprT-like domain-containing protein n=1 Tax=Cercospora beticola TaxID=122368 RepID=A0A2G5I3I6_CERBT|nr:hypothetical protein CB0940_02753 [Cercospora beticola]PIA99052.1 hypothetical protein CB0940_02753 [Cercospora beticola]WPA99901.1 hypothetical protein RHO25_004521 [Cercospora beticola]CAK1361927.1 unnamed protein product [Cercospora beticola]
MAVSNWYPGSSNIVAFPRPHNQPDIHYGGFGGVVRRRIPSRCFSGPVPGGGLFQNVQIASHYPSAIWGGRFLRGSKGISCLTDRSIAAPGDLGWTLEYATAWLYRYLFSSATEVTDAIDTLRELDDDYMGPDFAYMFFDLLDDKLFAGKLQGAVYLRWRSMPSNLPGVTSAPKVIPEIARVCIDLNRTPFEDDTADIDDLLCAMIHQMIHAFLLVCCGAQPKDDTPDDRMMDGLHFGVILMTIRDITVNCVDGTLDLIFHASKRRMVQNNTLFVPPPPPLYPLDGMLLAVDPRGHGHAAMLHDGRTHCNHDNRHVSRHQIKNWQVTEYSKALEAEMAAKGDKIWDFTDGETFEEFLRIHAPPSATYIELLYDDGTTAEPKRIMAKREKALKFKSLKEPLTTFLKFELAIPSCDIKTFRCIYDFINKDGYLATPLDQAAQYPITQGHGPPVLIMPQDPRLQQMALINKDESAITHVKVFKAGESMKFEELMTRAIQQLYRIPVTSEDPIALLKAIYNIEPPSKNPLHSELHRWARRFLYRCPGRSHIGSLIDTPSVHPLAHARGVLSGSYSISNMRKIKTRYPQQFRELLEQSRAFREDAELANAMLRAGGNGGIRRTILGQEHMDRHLLTSGGIMQSGSPLGLAASGGLAGLLPPTIPSGNLANAGLLNDGLDGLGVLGGSFGDLSIDGLEASLLPTASHY